ncbi:MAG TPA: tRNA (guanosine(46)-N7)-methyltransferase TrmB [Acetivibrio sp.]|uniref:tRNA (guanosine(46)-N7)-methyltransferase TrmB n=1 Tax=Acetivibrio sp. TaxID=1872092 RepID=UPI002C038347|nr:tRNA (guanosine(46)-N7)-methyltransferase TrmB [Acetivibrio sp.]HOM01828.1 tRNA (guanosine(46)-N7)-methyltransferase TrmB [Acetivibrio sp.]
MRLRKKPWARPALEACSFFVVNPTEYKGKWREVFGNSNEIWLELGCGKGGFISKLASSNLDKNFIAVDIKDEVLVLAKQKIEQEYGLINAETRNIRLMAHEIMLIHKMLDENDAISRIYINFCNPWPKNSHKTRRLTHPNQLNQYRAFLIPNGQIRFKTDDTALFQDSIRYFEQCGFHINYLTEDLHASGFEDNIETEHERMFLEQGLKIKFLIAEKI